MKPDYRNWVPESMVIGAAAGSACAFGLAAYIRGSGLVKDRVTKNILSGGLALTGAGAAAAALWLKALHDAFSYDGKRQLAKQIIENTAGYVQLPAGGKGLDVGCGSGALTIACAKRNPQAVMTGCDIWSGAYKAVFTKKVCEQNAEAEGVSNVCFEEGNAVHLPYADETFDAVTSNYVYHNIAGHNKQELLLETLRVLKKGGTFAIHDLMSEARCGDMDAFIEKLKKDGYEDVRLIATADGTVMSPKEAALLGLGGSALLTGRK
ncbi:MAG: class I SAM-dependent methyltransferase [Solobacterium sp.]|nr:class I SAM-dependent methyltransferase [Solobacterium sp.]